MKTELKEEILNAFNEHTAAMVDGEIAGMFFVQEAIELAKAEEAVERILNIPHNEQGLVDQYLIGFTGTFIFKYADKIDNLIEKMIFADASGFFLRLDRRIDEVIEVLSAVSVDERLLDVEPGELMKQIIEQVNRETEKYLKEVERMRQKLEAEHEAGPKDDDDDTEGIPF